MGKLLLCAAVIALAGCAVDAKYHINLGNNLVQEGDMELALVSFGKAIELDNSIEAFFGRARCYQTLYKEEVTDRDGTSEDAIEYRTNARRSFLLVLDHYKVKVREVRKAKARARRKGNLKTVAKLEKKHGDLAYIRMRTLIYLGWIRLLEKKPKDAAWYFAKVGGAYSGHLEALMGLATALTEIKGEEKNARDMWVRFRDRAKTSPEKRQLYGITDDDIEKARANISKLNQKLMRENEKKSGK